MAEQQDSLFEQIEDTPSDERPEEARASEKEWSLLEQRFSYALQYPTTIGPLFITALSLMLIVLQQWWLPGALLWALFYLALATAVVSFVALYSLQYEREYQKRENERANADFHDQNVRVEQEFQRLRKTLRTGFTDINSSEGVRALSGMTIEFDQLQNMVEGWPETSLVSISQIRILTEQTYRHGLRVLSGVLDLLLAIEVTDKANLGTDIQSLVKETEELTDDENQADRLKIKRAMLSEYRERLERLNVQELRAEEYLLKSSLIEGSLNRTRMELAALKADSSESGSKKISDALQATIEKARNVLDEMRELGY